MPSTPQLSVVIVSFNTRQLLDECLSALAEAVPPAGGMEIIVVDNASADGSPEMVAAKYPRVILIASDANRGFAAANNQGAAVACGRYVLFLNSDTRVSPEALVQPLAYLQAHPQVGAITVHLVYPSGQRDPDNHRGFPTPWNAFCHFSGLGRLFPRAPLFNGYFQSYQDFSCIHPVDVIAGSFIMMPMVLCRQLGGWDETYFFYGEDIDLCYRIGQAGYQIIYYPHVDVLHYKGASSGLRKESAAIARPTRETRVKVAKESVRAMQVFYRKFYSQQYPRPVTAMVLASIQLRGWFRILKHQLFFLLPVLFLFLTATPAASPVQATAAAFGYGFNVADWDIGLIQSMGFNWIKVFSNPDNRLPVNVLRRVDAHASDMVNLTAFGDRMAQLAQAQAPYIDAYEIGNEPNLDADYGWAAPPNAADYARLLCVAYNRIKSADPDAIIVSAGLAPTGRVQGNWNGHPGHNGLYQDERQYLLEFIAAGGGNCLDAVGYHPYGFSADYNAPPDVASGDSTRNCANGFCFRGVEKIYELMQANGLSHKKIWATEYGWIVQPPQSCMSDPGWQGRQWQIVTEAKQASNLVGSFEYATANWPWMGAMFIFNLNFNTVPWYGTCEQMRYYGVRDRPAESALRNMPKVAAMGKLEITPGALSVVIADEQNGYKQTLPVELRNTGAKSLTYTITASSGSIIATVNGGNGTLNPNQTAQMQVTIDRGGRGIGIYNASLTVATSPAGTEAPSSIPVSLFIFDQVHNMYLPAVNRN